MSKDSRTIKGIVKVLAGGAMAFAALFAVSLLMTASFAVFGVQDATIENIVKQNFGSFIIKKQALYLALYLLLGAWFSIPAAASRISSFFLGFFSSLFAGLSFFAYAAGCRPGLYAGWLNDRGGAAATFQRLVSQEPAAGFLIAAPILLYLMIRSLRKKDFAPMAMIIAVGAVTWFGMFYHPNYLVADDPADSAHPDIYLLAADSLRPDRLDCYGFERSVAPNIKKLCEQGIVFENAYVPLPRTFPSWASILTGMPPWKHGVRSMFPDPEDTVLKESLPRRLKDAGYETAVFSDYAGDIFPRMDAGFDVVSAPDFNFSTLVESESLRVHRFLLPFLDNRIGRRLFPIIDTFADAADARDLTDRVLKYLSGLSGKPRLVVVFYSTTHFPFAPSYPDVHRYTDPNYKGPFYFQKPPSLKDEKLTQADKEQIRDLFDACAHAVDRQIGRLVDAVKSTPRGRNAVFVITSDHGEALYEREGDIGHGDHFRGNQTLRVPLVISAPEKFSEPAHIDALVANMDIAPTLAALGGADYPDDIEGFDLSPVIEGKKPGRDLLFFETGLWFVKIAEGYMKDRRISYPDITTMGEIDYKKGTSITIKSEYKDITNTAKHRMAFDGQYKLLYIPTSSGIRWELYDLENDPEETRNLIEKKPAVAFIMKKALFDEMTSPPGVIERGGYLLPKNPAR